SNGQITVTQGPPLKSTCPGDTVTLSCKTSTSSGLGSHLYWYQQKDGEVDQPPTLTVLPPSSEEISKGSNAKVTCLANNGYPSGWTLSWKVDNKNAEASAVANSAGLLQQDGKYSWSSTLTLSTTEWNKGVPVTCEATFGSHTPVKGMLKSSDCSL
ncbi:hypothetical protein Z043_121995, partial [Scleropages formosus]